MNSPAVRPKPMAHQINMVAAVGTMGNNNISGAAIPLPIIPSGHPQAYQHGSCDAIYGHATRLNGVTKILAGNQSPAMSAISEPIYAMRMPRNCAPSQMSTLEMTNPRFVNKASEVPMLDAIKCDSMYSTSAKNGTNTNGCSETDKLLQQSTN